MRKLLRSDGSIKEISYVILDAQVVSEQFARVWYFDSSHSVQLMHTNRIVQPLSMKYVSVQAMKSAIAKTLARDNGREALDGIERFGAFNEGWQHVVWGAEFSKPQIPINASAPCCGFQCQSCVDNPDSKFWCKGPMKEHVRLPFDTLSLLTFKLCMLLF